MAITALPPLLVNQIAAGEVIERPASVVKELLENAIDAGAGRIEVAIEQGGRERIAVVDDGCGIPAEELHLAVAPHATSKITSASDLDAIATMGFRGEALASIASVSRMSIRSRPGECSAAAVIEAEGEQVSEIKPVGGPGGTAVTVRNLFFNTPARRRFLKTDQTETSRVREVVQHIALAHPQVGFTFQVDGRVSLDLPPGQSPRQRTVQILGSELEEHLLEMNAEDRGFALWGMLGKPAIARSTARHLHVFINGRCINDRTINHAIKEAYRGLIDPTRHPTAVLFIRVNPAEVDVNVHPAKAEVRFRHQGIVHGVVLSALRRTLREADLLPDVRFAASHSGREQMLQALPPMSRPEFGSGQSSDNISDSAANQHADSEESAHAAGPSFVDYFRKLNPQQKGFIYTEVKQALAAESPELLGEDASADNNRGYNSNSDNKSGERQQDDYLPQIRSAVDVLQVHSSFLVTQDEQGLVILDQHALHERVMFEKLKARLERGTLESQRMLMPATLTVDDRQVDALQELQPLLEKLGIDAQPMGPHTIGIHGFTSLLFERNVDPVSFLQELLTRHVEEGTIDTADGEAAMHEVLDMMACKAAIKAGDRLTAEELSELLAFRDQIERASSCPHGRPTSLRLSIRDLEKQFGRR